MVQRTGLALTLMLAFLAGMLTAQESTAFTPPKLASPAILEIPSNWKQNYSPPEVLILVKVKADSTAELVKILDGKDELQSMIRNLLPLLLFSPAVKDGLPMELELTLKLPIERLSGQVTQSSMAEIDSLRIVNKELVLKSVKERLKQENFQRPFSSDTFYRTNNYLWGPNHNSSPIIKDGFIQPSHLYYKALDYQILSNFRDLTNDTTGRGLVSFGENKAGWYYNSELTDSLITVQDAQSKTIYTKYYPWAAMCTDIYAGLGDYEFNFAKGQVLKNHLLGIKDFYAEFGFVVQNGWWQEVISDQTSSRLFLKYPLGNTNLLLNYESYDQNIPSSTLLPGLQSSDLYRIGQKLQDVYFKWELPWLTAGWRQEKEKLSASGILNRQDYTNGQFLLNKHISLLATDLDLTYQYNYKQELPEVQSLYQYNLKPEHQGLAQISHQHGGFNTDSSFLASEDGLDKFNLQAGYIFSPQAFTNFYYQQYEGKNKVSSEDDFYLDSTVLIYPSVYVKQSYAGEFGLRLAENLQLSIKYGYRHFRTSHYTLIQRETVSVDTEVPFSEIKFNLQHDFGFVNAGLEQYIQWVQYSKDLYEQPELQGQARLLLLRELNYSNTLSAGLNLTGHTDYTNADNQSTPIYGSLVADIWMGIKITDLFEFQLMMKNIGSNTLFGLNPNPRTVIGTIHWFFIN